jgi:hypothetical protein
MSSEVEVYAHRIRPYFGVLHDPVLRLYFSVILYGEIRCYTGKHVAKQESYRGSVNENHKRPFFLRLWLYFSVYDTEIYDRNTGSCKLSYFSVYDRVCLTWVINSKASICVLQLQPSTSFLWLQKLNCWVSRCWITVLVFVI